jgi:hypothetical protein
MEKRLGNTALGCCVSHTKASGRPHVSEETVDQDEYRPTVLVLKMGTVCSSETLVSTY